MTNKRRKAAEAAEQLRENMEEILETQAAEEDEIQAKIEAAAAIEGLDRAEQALRMWRDPEEEPIESLAEEPLDDDGDDETDASEEIQKAAEHVEAAASLLDDEDESSQ